MSSWCCLIKIAICSLPFLISCCSRLIQLRNQAVRVCSSPWTFRVALLRAVLLSFDYVRTVFLKESSLIWSLRLPEKVGFSTVCREEAEKERWLHFCTGDRKVVMGVYFYWIVSFLPAFKNMQNNKLTIIYHPYPNSSKTQAAKGRLMTSQLFPKIYNLMLLNLLKATISAGPDVPPTNQAPLPTRTNNNGWDEPLPAQKQNPIQRWAREQPFSIDQPPILAVQGKGRPFFQQHSGEPVGIEMNISQEASEKASQVLSVNEFGEEEHPMIISNFRSNNPIHFYRHALTRIHHSAHDLREQQQLFVDQMAIWQRDQQRLHEQFKQGVMQLASRLVPSLGSNDKQALEREVKTKSIECMKLSRELAECKAQIQTNRSISRTSSKRLQQERPCTKCRTLQDEVSRLREEMRQNQQQLDRVLIENEHLQEHIFDMEQKVAGIDLQVEERLRKKGRNNDLPPISPIREDKELIEHLQAEIASLQEKCLQLEQSSCQAEAISDKKAELQRMESGLQRKEAGLQSIRLQLQGTKQQNYKREHQLLVAEENLSRKISDLRKKETQLSQWEAQLVQKDRQARTQRDNTLAHQFPSNDPSFQEDLNRSGDSLKSFGRNRPVTDDKGSPGSIGETDNFQAYYKMQTLNDEKVFKNRPQHEFVRERTNYNVNDRLRTEGRRVGQANFGAARRDPVNDIGKKYNPQLSNYKDSREASPYRTIQDPAKTRQPYHQYALPKPALSPYREASKNSKASVSKSKLPTASVFAQQAAQSRGVPPRSLSSTSSNQLGGLGSKLQRLRQEIKKEIDSIK